MSKVKREKSPFINAAYLTNLVSIKLGISKLFIEPIVKMILKIIFEAAVNSRSARLEICNFTSNESFSIVFKKQKKTYVNLIRESDNDKINLSVIKPFAKKFVKLSLDLRKCRNDLFKDEELIERLNHINAEKVKAYELMGYKVKNLVYSVYSLGSNKEPTQS